MDEVKLEQPPKKRPRGRPPIGAVWENGEYRLTEEGLQNAVDRLEAHRKACRDRYRLTRGALKKQRPDLFVFRRKQSGQTALASHEATCLNECHDSAAVSP